VNNTAVSKELFEEVSRALLLGYSVILNNERHIPTSKNLEKGRNNVINNLKEVIKYRESTNQIKTITKETNTAKKRIDVVKNTVAELNINPVNLKALTRNIPLANIYRYANLAALYTEVLADDGTTIEKTTFEDPNDLNEVLKQLRKIIKRALSSQESSNTREGLMAIYDD
jgi:hypothetical protein